MHKMKLSRPSVATGVLLSLLIVGYTAIAASRPSNLKVWIVSQDYTRFWSVGQLLAATRWPAMFAISPSVSSWMYPLNLLSPQAGLHAWLYPPTMNLLAIAFALLPEPASYGIWDGFSLLAGIWLLRLAGLSWPAVLLGVCGPASLFSLAGGQTGTLLGSVLVSCLLRAEKAPVTAGLLAAFLSVKPQMGLVLVGIVPQWRGRFLLVCLMSVAVLLALSFWSQGLDSWGFFFAVSEPTGTQIVNLPWTPPFAYWASWSVSVFLLARSFGAGLTLAWAVQAFVGLAALILIAEAWRRPAQDQVRRMAYTVSLGALIMPYGFLYDMTGFGIGMASMLLQAGARGRIFFTLCYLASGFGWLSFYFGGHPLFPFVAAAAAWACRPGGVVSCAGLKQQ